MEIPGLRDSLVKILQDFNLQVNVNFWGYLNLKYLGGSGPFMNTIKLFTWSLRVCLHQCLWKQMNTSVVFSRSRFVKVAKRFLSRTGKKHSKKLVHFFRKSCESPWGNICRDIVHCLQMLVVWTVPLCCFVVLYPKNPLLARGQSELSSWNSCVCLLQRFIAATVE